VQLADHLGDGFADYAYTVLKEAGASAAAYALNK